MGGIPPELGGIPLELQCSSTGIEWNTSGNTVAFYLYISTKFLHIPLENHRNTVKYSSGIYVFSSGIPVFFH